MEITIINGHEDNLPGQCNRVSPENKMQGYVIKLRDGPLK